MWWIPLAQAAIGLGQSIYSGVQAGKERKAAQANLDRQNAENEAWYNKEYYTDYTQRADSQNLLRQLREQVQDNNRRAEATAAITGATPESVQAQRNAGNRMITDTMGNLAAMGAKHKDNVQQQYRATKAGLAGQQYNATLGNAQSHETGMYNGISQIGGGIMGAANNIWGSGGIQSQFNQWKADSPDAYNAWLQNNPNKSYMTWYGQGNTYQRKP